jgi:eukaryotic-like serine/threonine-protein kinase
MTVHEPAADDEEDLGGRFLENFRVEGMLGRGGMGEVYLATDEWMEREVAIKLIQRKYAAFPDFAERFRRETKALAKLSHPNIVRIYAAGKAPDGRLYMIMERLSGLPLRKIIDVAGRLDAVSVLHYGMQIAEAVDVAHAKGILHRDIKPENVLVGPGGHVWVLDFGLARGTTSSTQTDEKKEMGTTRYMSPEQVQGQRADERADLYAIGIVLYEMLAGCHPYPAVDEDEDIDETGILAAHVYGEVRPLPEIAPECPPALWELVARCLAKDRRVRPASANALAASLRAVLREAAPPDHPMAQRIARDHDEAAFRRAMEARQSAPSLSFITPASALGAGPASGPASAPASGPAFGPASEGRPSAEATADKPRKGSLTAPLPPGFVPLSPAASAQKARLRRGQGYTEPIDLRPFLPHAVMPFNAAQTAPLPPARPSAPSLPSLPSLSEVALPPLPFTPPSGRPPLPSAPERAAELPITLELTKPLLPVAPEAARSSLPFPPESARAASGSAPDLVPPPPSSAHRPAALPKTPTPTPAAYAFSRSRTPTPPDGSAAVLGATIKLPPPELPPAATTTTTTTTPGAATTSADVRGRRRAIVIAALGALGVLVMGAGLWLFIHREAQPAQSASAASAVEASARGPQRAANSASSASSVIAASASAVAPTSALPSASPAPTTAAASASSPLANTSAVSTASASTSPAAPRASSSAASVAPRGTPTPSAPQLPRPAARALSELPPPRERKPAPARPLAPAWSPLFDIPESGAKR